jgi:hypothetical protein
VSFNGPGLRWAWLRFLEPKRLAGLQAYNGGSETTRLLLWCIGRSNNGLVIEHIPAKTLVTIETGWTEPCGWVLVMNSNGWNTSFDNLVLAKGAD